VQSRAMRPVMTLRKMKMMPSSAQRHKEKQVLEDPYFVPILIHAVPLAQLIDLEKKLQDELEVKEKAFAALQIAKDHALKYKQQIESVKEMAAKQKAIVEKQLLQQLRDKEKRISDLEIALQDAISGAVPAALPTATNEHAKTNGSHPTSSSDELLAAQTRIEKLSSENESLVQQLPAATSGDSAVEQLRNQLASAQERLREITAKNKSLQSDCEALREKEAINSNVAQQQAALASSAQAEVEALKVHKFACYNTIMCNVL